MKQEERQEIYRNIIRENSDQKEIDISKFKNKTILVTGACGSIGSEILRQLSRLNTSIQIIALDSAETPMHNLQLELVTEIKNKKVIPILANINDHRRINSIFEQYPIQLVFHAAAYKHVPLMEQNPEESIKTNVLATKLLVKLSSKYRVERFIFISTDKAINPTSVMGASKRAAEIIVQNQFYENSKTEFITTRFGNVFGSNGSVIELFQKQIKNREAVTITHPKMRRYFMSVEEACSLVIISSQLGSGNEIFMFDMGKEINITTLAEKLIKYHNLIPYKDIKIEYTGLRPGEKLYEELFYENEFIISTGNEKIKIARTRVYEKEKVDAMTQELEKIISNYSIQNNKNINSVLKKYIPEFNPDS